MNELKVALTRAVLGLRPVETDRASTLRSAREFVEFLRGTLIPDLRESGTDATADDFETAATLIGRLAHYAMDPRLDLPLELTIDDRAEAVCAAVLNELRNDHVVTASQMHGLVWSSLVGMRPRVTPVEVKGALATLAGRGLAVRDIKPGDTGPLYWRAATPEGDGK